MFAQNVCPEFSESDCPNVDAPYTVPGRLNDKTVSASFCEHRPFIDNTINVIVKSMVGRL